MILHDEVRSGWYIARRGLNPNWEVVSVHLEPGHGYYVTQIGSIGSCVIDRFDFHSRIDLPTPPEAPDETD